MYNKNLEIEQHLTLTTIGTVAEIRNQIRVVHGGKGSDSILLLLIYLFGIPLIMGVENTHAPPNLIPQFDPDKFEFFQNNGSAHPFHIASSSLPVEFSKTLVFLFLFC
jgi:hypothetical protein